MAYNSRQALLLMHFQGKEQRRVEQGDLEVPAPLCKPGLDRKENVKPGLILRTEGRQKARLFELNAAGDLARLAGEVGNATEALATLRAIVDWFPASLVWNPRYL